MAKKYVCSQCGMESETSSKFCSACGSAVQVVEVPDPVSTTDYIPQSDSSSDPFGSSASGSYDTIPPTGSYSDPSSSFGTIPPVSGYQDPLYNYGMPSEQPQGGASNGCAIAGMIIGILSILLCCFNWIDAIVALVGLVLSIVGLKSKKYKGMAIAGLICSVIGILLSVFLLLAVLTNEEFRENVLDYYYDIQY